MSTATDEPRSYINTAERRGKYSFTIHYASSVLTRTAPLVSQHIYNSREEATAAAVRILVALMPPEKP